MDPLLDYCTGWFDRLTLFGKVFDWGYCCYQHDLSIGAMNDFMQGNLDLMVCVNDILPIMGCVMLIGVASPVGIFLYWREVWSKRFKAWWGRLVTPSP